MKNTFTFKSRRAIGFAVMMSMLVSGFMLSSCSESALDEPAYQEEVVLPSEADNFVRNFYPQVKLVKVTVSDDGMGRIYSAYLANAHIVRFDENGEWKDVVAPGGRPIPVGITPMIIEEYISKTNIGQGVNGISRDNRGYDVRLTNGVELNFGIDFAYTGSQK